MVTQSNSRAINLIVSFRVVCRLVLLWTVFGSIVCAGNWEAIVKGIAHKTAYIKVKMLWVFMMIPALNSVYLQ